MEEDEEDEKDDKKAVKEAKRIAKKDQLKKNQIPNAKD